MGGEYEVMMDFGFGFVGVASAVVAAVVIDLVGWKEEGRKPMGDCGEMNETSAGMSA